MTKYDAICDRWIDVCFERTTKDNFSRSNKIFADGDRIYSYGHHFEMARVLRDRKGKPRGFLINGERVSVTTTRHQGEVRSAIKKTGLPRVIIPYSALDAAGIDPDTVELIDVTEDRSIETKHVVYEQPENTKWVEVDDMKFVKLTDEELSALVAERNAKALADWKQQVEWEDEERDRTTLSPNRNYRAWQGTREQGPKVHTVEGLDPWDLNKYVRVGTHMELQWKRGYGGPTVKVLDDGRTEYSWTTHRHLLGESLVKGRINLTRRPVDCKKCNGTGQINPDLVVTRPGQISANLCRACDGVGFARQTRTAYFLSGFDHNEPREVYFFCELPRGVRPTTIEEAYEDLKPDAVKLAEQMGRTVRRQGDIFAIELRGTTKRALRARGARFEKRGNLLNTNHEATEVAYLPDGSTLVRGTLWHNPAFRDPDHVRCTVGKSWHIAIKNTVPIAA
jgi:hypothetical protein